MRGASVDASQLVAQGWEEINMSSLEEQKRRRDENQARERAKKQPVPTADDEEAIADNLPEPERTEKLLELSSRKPMNASADKTAGPFDLINSPSDYSHGAPSNEGPDDAKGQSVDDMVTASSVISSVSEILGNTSMDEEARIWRAYEALSDYIREAPVPEHQGSDKTAGPIDVENPAKSVEPNRAEVVLQQIADAMKEKSPHGSLNILEGSPHSRSTAMEPLLNAINKMLAAGFTFTPEEIEWITWPAEPYGLEGPPTEELRTQYDALGAKIRAVPGYEELDQILNSFYQ